MGAPDLPELALAIRSGTPRFVTVGGSLKDDTLIPNICEKAVHLNARFTPAEGLQPNLR